MKTRRTVEFSGPGSWRYALFAALLVTLATLACGSEEASPPEDRSAQAPTPTARESAPPKASAQTQRPESQPGNSLRDDLRQEIQMPDDYPSDAPVYPGSTTSRYEVTGGAVNVTFVTDDDPGEVAGYFEESLSDQGWSGIRSQSMSNSSDTMTSGSKAGRKISILSARVDKGSADAVTMIMVRVDE